MQIKLFTIPINEIESYNEELNKFLRTHKIIEVDFQCIPMLVHPSKKKKWLREGITLGNNKQNQSHLSQVGANPLAEQIGESQGNYNFVEINKSLVKEIEEFLPLKDGWKENYEYNK
jgi:hypothetical protein